MFVSVWTAGAAKMIATDKNGRRRGNLSPGPYRSRKLIGDLRRSA